MKALWKSIMVFAVCAAMVWSSSNPALAKGDILTYTYEGKVYTITTSDNGNNVTTVTVKSDEGTTSTVVLDKKTNVVQLKEANAAGAIVLDQTVSVVATKEPTQILPVGIESLNGGTNGSEWMFHHYYWTYTLPPPYTWGWGLSIPGGAKSVKETAGNSGELIAFKNDVDSADRNEATAVAMVGAGVVAAIAGALSAVPTATMGLIIGLLVALGAGITAAGSIYSAWVDCKDADFHFARIN